MSPRKKTGVTTLKGSSAARKSVAAILEALSGEIGTGEAAELLGVSLSRYYQLEGRALTGMLAALEPKKRGYQKTPEREISGLEAEKKKLERELRRHQSLLRAAHRSLGLARKGRKKASLKGGTRKHRARGKTVLKTLRREASESKGEDDGTVQRDGGASAQDAGERAGAQAHERDPADA
jgi:hypothetical protein